MERESALESDFDVDSLRPPGDDIEGIGERDLQNLESLKRGVDYGCDFRSGMALLTFGVCRSIVMWQLAGVRHTRRVVSGAMATYDQRRTYIKW